MRPDDVCQPMQRCDYVTERGSRVRPIRKSSWEITFDWLEEGACVEAVPAVDTANSRLLWSCECCDGGGADLINTN